MIVHVSDYSYTCKLGCAKALDDTTMTFGNWCTQKIINLGCSLKRLKKKKGCDMFKLMQCHN